MLSLYRFPVLPSRSPARTVARPPDGSDTSTLVSQNDQEDRRRFLGNLPTGGSKPEGMVTDGSDLSYPPGSQRGSAGRRPAAPTAEGPAGSGRPPPPARPAEDRNQEAARADGPGEGARRVHAPAPDHPAAGEPDGEPEAGPNEQPARRAA